MRENFEVKEYSRRAMILNSKGVSYKEFLKSPIWARAKERLIKFRGGIKECRICKSRDNIQVHHNNYNERNLSGRIRALVMLCDDCHGLVHGIAKVKNWNYHKTMRSLIKRYKRYGDTRGYAKGDKFFPKLLADIIKK